VKKLKAFVGLNGRFVMCEGFPYDQEHAGLHNMLQDFIDYDIVLTDEPLEKGFYELEFEFDCQHYTDPQEQDACLIVKNIKRITKEMALSEVTEEELEGLPED